MNSETLLLERFEKRRLHIYSNYWGSPSRKDGELLNTSATISRANDSADRRF